MKMFLITRPDADRVALHERLEGAGWRAFGAEEYPVFREWRDPEGAPLTYEEVSPLGVRVIGVRGSLPAALHDWGGLVALDSLGPDGGPLGDGWKLEALRARMDLGLDEARLAPLIEVACGDDPRAAGVVLRAVTTVAYMEQLLRAVAARFDAETERGRYARTMLDHIAPDDPAVIARRRAAAVPGLERLGALREAFHGGDGLLTEALATLLVDDGHVTAEVMAMRGEARRHAGETWRAAIDLLFARHDAAQEIDPTPEPAWVGPALDALHPLLASGEAGPLPVDALDPLLRRMFVGLPCLRDLLPIAGDATHAVASRLALLALRSSDRPLAREAAERALAERPDEMTTCVIAALALGRDRAASEPDALDRLEEAWRRLLHGPIDDVDLALLALAEGDRLPMRLEERLAELRLHALKRQGHAMDQVAFAREAVERMPWSLSLGAELGIALTGLERHDAAIEAYSRVIDQAVESGIEDAPPATLSFFNRACERAITGDHDAALVDLEAAIRGDESWAEAAATDDYFASLRGDPRFEKLCRGEIEKVPAVVEGVLAPIARVLCGVEASGVSREELGDAIRDAVRGQPPSPRLARMPDVPEALASLGRLLAHREVMVAGMMAMELYAAGENELDETFAMIAPMADHAVRAPMATGRG